MEGRIRLHLREKFLLIVLLMVKEVIKDIHMNKYEHLSLPIYSDIKFYQIIIYSLNVS